MIYYHKYDMKYCLGVHRPGFSRETENILLCILVHDTLWQIWYEILSGCKPLWVFEGNWCWKYSWVRLTWDAGRVHFFFLLWKYLKYQSIILTHFSLYSSRFSSKIEKRGLLKKNTLIWNIISVMLQSATRRWPLQFIWCKSGCKRP